MRWQSKSLGQMKGMRQFLSCILFSDIERLLGTEITTTLTRIKALQCSRKLGYCHEEYRTTNGVQPYGELTFFSRAFLQNNCISMFKRETKIPGHQTNVLYFIESASNKRKDKLSRAADAGAVYILGTKLDTGERRNCTESQISNIQY